MTNICIRCLRSLNVYLQPWLYKIRYVLIRLVPSFNGTHVYQIFCTQIYATFLCQLYFSKTGWEFVKFSYEHSALFLLTLWLKTVRMLWAAMEFVKEDRGKYLVKSQQAAKSPVQGTVRYWTRQSARQVSKMKPIGLHFPALKSRCWPNFLEL